MGGYDVRENGIVGATVFVEAWQIQCCGDPLAVGGSIWLTTVPPDDSRSFLEKMLGARAAGVTDLEEHHMSDRPAERRVGTIRSIEAVFCLYDRIEGSSFELRRDSQTIEPRTRVNGHEPEDREGDVQRTFMGYLVGLD